MWEVVVIEDAAAGATLDPIRARLLAELVLQATASSYVISPAAPAAVEPAPVSSGATSARSS
ncbi:hypothetical protein [Microtetraspora malaysiensis]|uniref:hypothetical protein n=1 Tax=Microtetraspora malaysiensis TaxID=161358 RepID=UPI003D8FD0FC